MSRARVLISGRVQGVGFRYYTVSCALDDQITGWVRNLPDGRVEAEVVGDKDTITHLVEELRAGPPGSHVADISLKWLPEDKSYSSFNIRY